MARLTISTRSQLLGQSIDFTVVMPDGPSRSFSAAPSAASLKAEEATGSSRKVVGERADAPRVCYLLHGTSGNHRTWGDHVVLHREASRRHLAFVSMSAGRSFYLNWDAGLPWSDFLAFELPELVADCVRVDTTPGSAIIAGLSAGGYGAFHAALTHPQLYAAAGSLSGVLDIASAYNRPRRAELYRGAFVTDNIAGSDVDLLALLRAGSAGGTLLPKLWAACGSSDHVLPQSRRFLEVAAECGVDLTYREWEGDHDWEFWTPAAAEFFAWLSHEGLCLG